MHANKFFLVNSFVLDFTCKNIFTSIFFNPVVFSQTSFVGLRFVLDTHFNNLLKPLATQFPFFSAKHYLIQIRV
jgi:hypothetical protein